MSKVTLFRQKVREISHYKKDNITVSNLKITKVLKLRQKVHLRTASNDGDTELAKPASNLKDARFT